MNEAGTRAEHNDPALAAAGWRVVDGSSCFHEGESRREATIREFRMVRLDGTREVVRKIEHYRLPATLAASSRMRSHPGVQFRQSARARLSEYLVKGFTSDDEGLEKPSGEGQHAARRTHRARCSKTPHHLVGVAGRLNPRMVETAP